MLEVYQTETYCRWFDSLRDKIAKTRIDIKLRKLSLGYQGDIKSVGNGIFELKIKDGPGYRIYFEQFNNKIVILLVGGDKSTQSKDIKQAKEIALNLEVTQWKN